MLFILSIVLDKIFFKKTWIIKLTFIIEQLYTISFKYLSRKNKKNHHIKEKLLQVELAIFSPLFFQKSTKSEICVMCDYYNNFALSQKAWILRTDSIAGLKWPLQWGLLNSA